MYLISRRDSAVGFAKDAGDFFAHPHRDRGLTYNFAERFLVQVIFAQLHHFSGNPPISINSIGDCEWWLKPWLIAQCADYFAHEKRFMRLKKKQVLRSIRSWFPEKDRYPKAIHCQEPTFLSELTAEFCKTVCNIEPFQPDEAIDSLIHLLRVDGVKTPIEDVFTCLLVCLNHTSLTMPQGNSVRIHLTVSPYFMCPLYDKTGTKPRQLISSEPHGVLGANVSLQSGFLPFPIEAPIIQTNIDTKNLFCPTLKTWPSTNSFDLRQPLAFDSDRNYPVFAIDQAV